MTPRTNRRKAFTPALAALGVAAVLGLRVLGASPRGGSDGSERSDPVRYLCFSGLALDLGRDSRRDEAVEGRAAWSSAAARHGCSLYGLPEPEGRQLVAGVAGTQGLRLEVSPKPPRAALESLRGRLRDAGWRETGGSRELWARKTQRMVVSYERDSAVVVAIAVPRGEGTLLVVAEQLAR